jgi:hypothetical protein
MLLTFISILDQVRNMLGFMLEHSLSSKLRRVLSRLVHLRLLSRSTDNDQIEMDSENGDSQWRGYLARVLDQVLCFEGKTTELWSLCQQHCHKYTSDFS